MLFVIVCDMTSIENPEQQHDDLIAEHNEILAGSYSIRVNSRWGDFTEYSVRIKCKWAAKIRSGLLKQFCLLDTTLALHLQGIPMRVVKPHVDPSTIDREMPDPHPSSNASPA